jgi:putative aldouronate transport system permease protein
MMVMHRSSARKVFEVALYAGFALFALSIILPFMNVIALSLSSAKAINQGRVLFFPQDFYPQAYKVIITSGLFLRSLGNTVFTTGVCTVLQIVLALMAGYALSSRHFYGARVVFIYLLIPMYFSGGLIPFFIVVNRLGLYNTYGALIFPSLVSIFYIIVFRNAIHRLPAEMAESGEIDGASEFRILFRIIIPLILPMIMAFTIFSAVNYWNQWFNVLVFIRDKNKWLLQYLLRHLYTNPAFTGDLEVTTLANDVQSLHPQNMVMAAIMCTVVPIIVIYPFLQRYFIHGVIVGAVKG